MGLASEATEGRGVKVLGVIPDLEQDQKEPT